MTVISEILQPPTSKSAASASSTYGATTFPDGHYPDSIESTSSLVQIIEEIRNNSLCNLLYCAENPPKPKAAKNTPAPQVPPRNNANNVTNNEVITKVKVPQTDEESPKPEEVQERRKKSALYTSVGSRKNLLELAGTTNHILNTPQKVIDVKTCPLSILDPAKLMEKHATISTKPSKEFDRSTLRPFENSCSLSPSAKYETPTPPLKVNQFVRNNNAYRPRRKFSILREKFEDQQNNPPRPMILKNRKNDLYENISDDFLKLRSNSIREKQDRMKKCQSVPSFIGKSLKNFRKNVFFFIFTFFFFLSVKASSQEMLRADEHYIDNFAHHKRNQWSTASYQRPPSDLNGLRNQRNTVARRSMSILDEYDKENNEQFVKHQHTHVAHPQPPPPLRPKLRSVDVNRGSPKAYRLSTGASLSPSSRIFARGGI